jgi:uncharacterized protein (TIRG00374 family)
MPQRRLQFSCRSLLFSLAVLLLAALWAYPSLVLAELSRVDLRWLPAAFAVALLQLLVLGLRWSRIASCLGLQLGFLRATLEYALSVAVNLLLPSGFAGDGFRAYRHARWVAGLSPHKALEALVLDRVSGQMAMLMVVAVAVPFGTTSKVFDLGVPVVLASGAAAVLLALALAARLSARVLGLMQALGRFLLRAARVLLAPSSVIVHLPLSLLFSALSVAQLYIAALAVGAELLAVQLLVVGPLILLAASLPSFYGGWGVREGASGLLFAAAGLPAGTGVAMSVVYGVFGLVVHLPGLLVLWAPVRTSEAARVGAKTEQDA